MNSKRFRFAVAALLTLTFLVSSAVWAQAQSIHLKANIPFAFRAGEKLMLAGEYDVQTLGNGVAVRILGPDADRSVMFTTVGISRRIGGDKDAKLIFNKYGEDYVLSEMWWPEQQDGRKAFPSKTEGELAKNVTPVRIAVALR
jgi:hypothetical protein